MTDRPGGGSCSFFFGKYFPLRPLLAVHLYRALDTSAPVLFRRCASKTFCGTHAKRFQHHKALKLYRRLVAEIWPKAHIIDSACSFKAIAQHNEKTETESGCAGFDSEGGRGGGGEAARHVPAGNFLGVDGRVRRGVAAW